MATETMGDSLADATPDLRWPVDAAAGAMGAGCGADGDCDPGLLCLDVAGVGVCTRPCVVGCPPAWDCKTGPTRGGDLLFVCFPPGGMLCQACLNDAQCQGGRCAALADGARCTRPCHGDGDCPLGFDCVAARDLDLPHDSAPPAAAGDSGAAGHCVPRSRACDCTPATDGEAHPCQKTNAAGTCHGTFRCDATAGWTACDAPIPEDEACNGRDDDCDGLIDEDSAPPSPDCAVANDHGACRGDWVCRGRDGFVCVGPTPEAEGCDGVDNDCDGATDEDFRDPGTGAYTSVDHCGRCGLSCHGRLPHAALVACEREGGDPHCVAVRCTTGFHRPPGLAICVPLGQAGDCSPCARHDDCDGVPGGLCVPLGDGGFCARSCAADSDCVGGFRCDAHAVCLPPSGSCSCLPGSDGALRACFRANDDGVCAGEQVCDPERGWGPCSAPAPNPEVCDGSDNDCDGETDEPGARDCTPYFRDVDGDGFGDPYSVLCQCGPTATHPSSVGGDCDDTDGSTFPGADEHCNGRDDDCNGRPDDDGAAGCVPKHADRDRDGHGDPLDARCLCAAVGIHDAAAGSDCDDTSDAVHPGGVETCNGLDDDCDGATDERFAVGCVPHFADGDVDGHGDPTDAACECASTVAHPVVVDGDCDDADPRVHPGAPEVCGGGDEDCDGHVDEEDAVACRDFWEDVDGDGFGVPLSARCFCGPTGDFRALQGGDCADRDAAVNPAATEPCALDADCCADTAVCRHGACVARPAPCGVDADCRADRYCDVGECLPYGVGPRPLAVDTCRVAVAPRLFRSSVPCTYAGPPSGDAFPDHVHVLGSPVVVDFDLDRDPQTVAPSIVFVAYDRADSDASPDPAGGPGADPAARGVIRVVDGATCAHQATVGTPFAVPASTPALADIDGDGHPDIVALAPDGGLHAFRNAGGGEFPLLWASRTPDGLPARPAAGVARWGGPTVTDLDGDGRPEVLVGAVVFDAAGVLQADNLGLGFVPPGPAAVVADVDRDGLPELVLGTGVYAYTAADGAARWEREAYVTRDSTAGMVALGDFGVFPVATLPDDAPEVVVAADGTVRIQLLTGRVVFGPFALPDSPGGLPTEGGLPVVADVTGDGRAEIGVAGAASFTVFDRECSGALPPIGCAGDGILWTVPLVDPSSGSTGAAVFDFEDDGRPEVVVADACFARVLDGLTGSARFSAPRRSGTFLEAPVVVDADGDGRAEILVTTNSAPSGATCPDVDPLFRGLACADLEDCPGGRCVMGLCRCASDAQCGADGALRCVPAPPNTPGAGDVCRAVHRPVPNGLTVYRAGAGAAPETWAETRAVVHQLAYFGSNITDAGAVPPFGHVGVVFREGGHNHFRAAEQGPVLPVPLPDLTLRPGVPGNCDADGLLSVAVDVCNRGAAATRGPVRVVFEQSGAAGSAVICDTAVAAGIAPGECAPVACPVAAAAVSGVDVLVMADPTRQHTECRAGNAEWLFRGLSCRNLP